MEVFNIFALIQSGTNVTSKYAYLDQLLER